MPTAQGDKRATISDETAQQVVDLYVNEGLKLADITKRTGVPRSSIYWILQREGVDPNRQGTRQAKAEGATQAVKWAMERIEALSAENARLQAEANSLRAQLATKDALLEQALTRQ